MQDTSIDTKISPMMQQWHDCKTQSKEAILLFRLGDFYEAFHEDAVILSKVLEITLTKRQEIPMAGLPAHACEPYIDKLVSKGYRVAIAEQMEDPKNVKGIVPREIVRIVSPGTLVSSTLLKDKSNNYIMGLSLINRYFGMAVLDVSTGEFSVLECEDDKKLLDEIYRVLPKEIIVSEKIAKLHPGLIEELKTSHGIAFSTIADFHFDLGYAIELLCQHFKIHTLDCFGLQGDTSSIIAAGALLTYVRDDLCLNIEHVRSLRKESTASYMAIDRATQRHLELFETIKEQKEDTSLLAHLDETKTPMGGRLLKKWLTYPLLSPQAIQERHLSVEAFYHFFDLKELTKQLSQVRDLERILMRIETGLCSPKDLMALADSLKVLPKISDLLKGQSASLIRYHSNRLHDLTPLAEHIHKALVEDPPVKLSDGNVFAKGFNSDLDELKTLQEDAHTWVANYQIQLRAESGIKTLKVGYTKVFGYYIEISKGAAKEAPAHFIRRQTLVNAERFVTDELKEFEYKLLHAEERLGALEQTLFQELRVHTASHADAIYKTAESTAVLDVLHGFATLAKECNYVKPLVDDSDIFLIEEGRHPLVEKSIGRQSFIANDLHLSEKVQRMMIITGPNMAGKSTYIRQVALIAILAQAGSFVPAKKVHLGVLDKVFSRIGASDDLSKGQSTFMVEMSETANILNNATKRSLVILDEIGRGTSTYDGVSIAWAVADYLLNHPKGAPKTLFATHYFELTALEGEIEGAVNYNVAVQENLSNIVFLRKIVKGGTDRSYGIHVAKLAGLPASVIAKASNILKKLEKNQKIAKPKKEELPDLFAPPTVDSKKEAIWQDLEKLDIEKITPIDALQKLFLWKQKFHEL